MEKWLPIPGFEGKHEVSNTGRVRSLQRVTPYRGKFNRTFPAKMLKPCVSGQYHCVTLSGQKRIYIHKAVAMAFLPNPQNKKEVNHKDLNKLNNCVENLEWVTPKENMAHARKNGVIPIVTKCVLSNDLVIDIFKANGSLSEIAKRLNVKYEHVYRIKNKLTWSHLTNNL
jgi:hypothetical protein